MAILLFKGQRISLDDEAASDDTKVLAAVANYVPNIDKANICREVTDGQLQITVSQPNGSQETPLAVLDKSLPLDQTPQLDPTWVENWQLQVEQESSANEPAPIPPPYTPLQYRAIGVVKGQYFPSHSDLIRGILVMEDGAIAPVNFLASSINFLKKHMELLDAPQFWVVYPKTQLKAPHLSFAVKGVKTPSKTENAESLKDRFSVRGLITYIDSKAGMFTVRIYHNHSADSSATQLQNFFLLTIQGTLNSEAFGQFGDLDVRREGDKLILEKADFVSRLFQPKKQKRKKKQRRRQGKTKANESADPAPSQQ